MVAATLLDLKAARLLPSGEVEDEEDLALLEARDLLFARLLQYRAYKQVAAVFASWRRPRPVATRGRSRWSRSSPGCCPRCCSPSPEQLARIAAEALRPESRRSRSRRPTSMPPGSASGSASVLRERLARSGQSTFRALTQDCQHTVELVARFLALLELYREGVVAFDQVSAAGQAVGPLDRYGRRGQAG